MRRKLMTISLLLTAAAAAAAHAQKSTQQWTGVVTKVDSPERVEVNGQRIVLAPATHIETVEAGRTQPLALPDLRLFVGERVDVIAAAHGRGADSHFEPERFMVYAPAAHKVAGRAVIDATLPLPANSPQGTQFVRADGYPILVPAGLTVTFSPPLQAGDPIHTNLWITYEGMQGPDGVVVASRVAWSANKVTRLEGKLRRQAEQDTAAADPQNKPGTFSKFVHGQDWEKIPPYPDQAMQDRVKSIGNKLIPRYQRDLPAADPSRIDFRFQVVDANDWDDTDSGVGIIVVSRMTVERMQNDSQLAAVLAVDIAAALEKQAVLTKSSLSKMTAAELAVELGALFVPGGLGSAAVASGIANGAFDVQLRHLHEDQSGRVSLSLLRDAGFDLDQAPLAWWLLNSKKPKPRSDIAPPRRALYLYEFLGSTYSPQTLWAKAVD